MRNLLFLLAVVALGWAEVVLGLAADECYVMEASVQEESGATNCTKAAAPAGLARACPVTAHSDDRDNTVPKSNENTPRPRPATAVEDRGQQHASNEDAENRRQLSASLRTILLLSLTMHQAASR